MSRYGFRKEGILGAGIMRAKARGWDIRQRSGWLAWVLVNVSSTTILTESLGRQDQHRGCWVSGSLVTPHVMEWNEHGFLESSKYGFEFQLYVTLGKSLYLSGSQFPYL